MDYNAFEDNILMVLQTALSGQIVSFIKGLPEKFLPDAYEPSQLPALHIQSNVASAPSGMSTVSEIEKTEPVQFYCILSGSARETVRQQGNTILSAIESAVHGERGNSGSLGINCFVEHFDKDTVQVIKKGERWFAVLQPSMTVKCFEQI